VLPHTVKTYLYDNLISHVTTYNHCSKHAFLFNIWLFKVFRFYFFSWLSQIFFLGDQSDIFFLSSSKQQIFFSVVVAWNLFHACSCLTQHFPFFYSVKEQQQYLYHCLDLCVTDHESVQYLSKDKP
jgi:hypothetical protein